MKPLFSALLIFGVIENMLDNKKLHHIGIAVGLIGLGCWYLVAERLSLFSLITEQFPESHKGAGLMVAIMVVMTPGFFIWKHYNRWLEKALAIKGKYYEDSYYQNDSETKQK